MSEEVELVPQDAWGLDRLAWEGDDTDESPFDLEDPLVGPLEDPRD